MFTLIGNGFTFEAPSLETAFVANMLATRFSESVTNEGGGEVFPAIPVRNETDAVADWAKANGYDAPQALLFRHVHRAAGRALLLECLDSFKAKFLHFPAAVRDARECAKTLREIPLPFATDADAKDEIARIAKEKADGQPPKLDL